MKTIPMLLLAAALAIPVFAQSAAPKSASGAAAPAPSLPASAAELTKPFVLKDGAISQPERTEIATGGKAVFSFTVAKAGTYVIQAVANAADEDSNSFFLNIDAAPDDAMIWDVEVTNGFEERVVNWRGNGDSGSGEFMSKKFTLTAGAHKLIIVGREPAALKSVSIRPAN